MKIKELINEMEYEILAGSEETEITTLVYDSRKVEKGSVFVCISGSVRDAHEFIPDVAAKGSELPEQKEKQRQPIWFVRF